VIGVLCVGDHTPRAFAPDDVDLVQALADQAALAIEQARLLARSRDAAALEERARLARDLHDSVTQSVFSAGMLAHTARLQHERGTATVGETLARVQTVLGDALSEMRALLYELQPTALADEGLAKALEKLARSMQVRTDAAVRYEGAPVPRLAPETETAIFRIVQEALGNAVKYARATTIRLTLTADGARLIAAVADDGVGFDQTVPVTPSADGRRGGMGLRAMRERAAAAGLRVTVASEPGHGARVTVEAPLVPPASASA
jgi:signal transduction histidine kinase